MWDDKGLVLPRSMMANWNIKISFYYLEPLYKMMHNKIKAQSKLLHCDETTIQCNKEAGRKATNNSYMWVLRSGENEEKKGIVDINNEKTFISNFFYSSHPGFWPRLGFNAFWFKGIGRK